MLISRTPVLICAYNESKNIPNLFKELSTQRYDSQELDIILINDGSSDKTGEIAIKSGATKVINLPRNLGKASAFFYGLKYLLEKRYESHFLSFDADIESINSNQLESLLNPIVKEGVQMTIGSVCGAMSSLSGQRGYNLSILSRLVTNPIYNKLLQESSILRIGYGLEVMLNFLVTGETELSETMNYNNVRFVDTDLKCLDHELSEFKIKHRLKSPTEVRLTKELLKKIKFN